jgi:hypothetical protein
MVLDIKVASRSVLRFLLIIKSSFTGPLSGVNIPKELEPRVRKLSSLKY